MSNQKAKKVDVSEQSSKSKPKLALVGEDGNAFSILARARRALRQAGYSQEEIEDYLKQAKSGDYNHLLQVTMEWFDCSSEEDEEEDDEGDDDEGDDDDDDDDGKVQEPYAKQSSKSKPKLKLVGEDGNAFSILARARRALQQAGYSQEEIEDYLKQAQSGDYNHLLQVTMEWFECK